MSEKLCLFCKHFSLCAAERGYSEWTPGSDFTMSCAKNHWIFHAFEESEEKYRERMLTAKKCKDYTYYKTIKI